MASNKNGKRGQRKTSTRTAGSSRRRSSRLADAGGAAKSPSPITDLLVEQVHDYAIFALDPKGHVITWNVGAERIKGYRDVDIVGQHFSRFYPAEDIAAGKPRRELEIAAREGRFEDEGWRLRQDGTRFWANVVLTALRDKSGRLVGYAKVTRDLTERRAAEEMARRLAVEAAARAEAERREGELAALNQQLQEQQVELEYQMEETQSLSEDLEETNELLRKSLAEAERARADAVSANRVKADFLAAMSHELRTPLNAIGGYTQLLAMGIRGPLNEAQLQDLQRIRSSQEHLLEIINQILGYSRIEAGQVHFEIRPFALEPVLRTVQEMLEPIATAKQLAFTIEVPSLPLRAIGDPPKVEQILLNLLTNAIKFTGPGGVVGVRSSRADEIVLVEVHDTGIGIPGDQLERIFDPFVQVGRSLTRSAEGTGLGLAISRDLAQAMRAQIEVRSAPGEGSVFTLRLPAAP